jgi:hypothetical protein
VDQAAAVVQLAVFVMQCGVAVAAAAEDQVAAVTQVVAACCRQREAGTDDLDGRPEQLVPGQLAEALPGFVDGGERAGNGHGAGTDDR